MQIPGREQEDKLSMGQGALGEYRRTQTRQLPTAEDALKHLLLTVDVERLYRLVLFIMDCLIIISRMHWTASH